MTRILDVYLHEYFVGQLVQDLHGKMMFQYADAWLSSFEAKAVSQSLPLGSAPYLSGECEGFFGGILPEGNNREIIAKNLGISPRNDLAMLEKIGGECAGAITFVSSGKTLQAHSGQYRPLSEQALAEILKVLPRRPLLAGEEHVRLSLAGAQDKLAVYVDSERIFLPLEGAPSTHILKPNLGPYPGMVVNEFLCMQLAKKIGLPTPSTVMGSVDGIEYLLIERYDRVKSEGTPNSRLLQQDVCQINSEEEKGSITGQPLARLHQEDFCQALGMVSAFKYQHEGGPSLQQCFQLLRDASTVSANDVLRLLTAVIFNFLIGNHEAHGKNFSLLYRQNDAKAWITTLTPLYDLVCTAYYSGLSKDMAMKIGGKYESEEVYPRHFERFADDVGLNKPMVRRRILSMAREIQAKLPEVMPAHPVGIRVAAVIRGQCDRTIERFKK